MPVTYSTGAKNARMTATRDACADGSLEILTSADAVPASIGLSTATAAGTSRARGSRTVAAPSSCPT